MKPSPHRETDFHFAKMIIGSSLEALVTAYKYEIPVLGIPSYKPLPHYYIPSDLDLSPISCQNRVHEFTYLSGRKIERGMQAIELWDIMYYRLSLMGLAPFWGSWSDIFIGSPAELHELKAINLTRDGKSVNVNFDRAIFFDIPKHLDGKKIYFVNDYIDIKTVYDFPCNIFISENCDFTDTLAYETVFYDRTPRLQGCCVKSIIPEENLDDWDFGETSIRMKTERDIFWNIDKNIKMDIAYRETAPILTKMCESLEDIIHFDAMDIEVYD